MARPALVGRRILITRAVHQARELAEALSAPGCGACSFLPGLAIAPPQSYAAVDEALTGLSQFDWLVFTSQNAVEAFALRAGSRILSSRALIAAVGPKTAKAIATHGMSASSSWPKKPWPSRWAELCSPGFAGNAYCFLQAEEARDASLQTHCAAPERSRSPRGVRVPHAASGLTRLRGHPRSDSTFTATSMR